MLIWSGIPSKGETPPTKPRACPYNRMGTLKTMCILKAYGCHRYPFLKLILNDAELTPVSLFLLSRPACTSSKILLKDVEGSLAWETHILQFLYKRTRMLEKFLIANISYWNMAHLPYVLLATLLDRNSYPIFHKYFYAFWALSVLWIMSKLQTTKTGCDIFIN